MMNKIAIQYIGGRPMSKLYFNRQPFIFNEENDFTCEVPFGAWETVQQSNIFVPAVIGSKTEPKLEPEKIVLEENLTCECGFTAKTKQGLIVHRSFKHKGE